MFLSIARCQWCGLTAHSSCLVTMSSAQSACQFGVLEPIFLPPSAISIPRTQLSQNNVLPSKNTKDHTPYAPIRASISDDWSSTGMLEAAAELEGMGMCDREKYKERRDKERQKERARVEKEKESDEGEF